MPRVDESSKFVNRTKEIENITRLLSTGDVLLLGEAGIGKTALVNKIVENLSRQENAQSMFIRINATPASYSGWLPERLAQKVYQQIEADQKTLHRIRKWLNIHGPDVLAAIIDIYKTATGQPNALVRSPAPPRTVPVPIMPIDYKRVVLTLLDQYFKQVGKEIYIIVEDVHDLSVSDKGFLTDLLANHSGHIHFLISRRTQEDGKQLYSSPEVSYLMKANRIVRILGLNKDAVELFLKARKVDYDPKGLDGITELLRGNPYLLNLLTDVAINYNRDLKGKFLKILTEQDFSQIWNYLHSQFLTGLAKFEPILKASSILPANIHPEIIGRMLDYMKIGEINDQLIELEKRRVFSKEETGGYHFFHPLFELYIYKNLTLKDRGNMHNIAASYYKKLAETSPTPLNMAAALYHSQHAGNKNMEFWVLIRVAAIYERVGRLNESKDYVDKSLKIARKLNDKEKEFRSLILLFSLAPNLIIEKLDEELVRLKYLATEGELKTERNQIETLLAEANYYVGLDDPAKAIKVLRKSIQLAEKAADQKSTLYLIQYEASLLLDFYQFRKAKRLLIRCLDKFEKLGEERGILFVLHELGNIECFANPKKALKFFERCLEISKRRKDPLVTADTLHGIGIAYFELGKYEQAEKSFRECLRMTKRANNIKGLIATYTELARAMVKNRRFSDASKTIQKAQSLSKDAHFKGGNGQIEWVKGEIFEAEGKLAKAMQSFLRASELFRRFGNESAAENALQRASRVGYSRPKELIINVNAGKLSTKIGPDGYTIAERQLAPFVGKKVEVMVNMGKLNRIPERFIYEGILHKEKYSKRLTKADRLLGFGKHDWWIEGRNVGNAESIFGNWIIQPFFVESVKEIK